MTEKLKPSSLAEALFYADWPDGDDKWEQHNTKGPDAAARRYMRLAEVAAAWNTRATGWHTDVLNAPQDRRFAAQGFYKNSNQSRLEFIHWSTGTNGWVDDEGYPFILTAYMLITPPDSEAPHD